MKKNPPVEHNSIKRIPDDCSKGFFPSYYQGTGIARLGAGLFLLTWVSALSMPFEVWPYFIFLPMLFFKGISRLAFAWCLIILWVWLGIPSVSGRGFALLKAILPVVIGSISGRFIRERRFQFLGILLVATAPFCILSIVQWFYRLSVPLVWLSGQERWILPTRVTAVYQNPNLFAEVILFLLPIGLAWLLGKNRRGIRILGWVWVALAFSGLVLTFSYGAWIAAVFGISVLAAICFTKRPRMTALIITIAAISILAVIGIFHGSTAIYRWALWREAWHIFLKNPWGVSPGGLQELLAISQTPSNHVHNLFLQTLAETGIPGIFVLCLMMREVILQFSQAPNLNRAGAIAALSGLLLYGMVDYIWATPLGTGLFWLGVGMLGDSA